MQYRSFKEARKYVRSQKLKNYIQWLEFARSNKKPSDLPICPWSTYRKEWQGLGDWLNTGNVAPYKRKFRSFNEARQYTRSLKLKSFTEWKEFYKSKWQIEEVPGS